MRPRAAIAVVLVAVAGLGACSESRRPTGMDGGSGDAGRRDGGPVISGDAAPRDAGKTDAGKTDAGNNDAGRRDAGTPIDAAMCDVARCPPGNPERLPYDGVATPPGGFTQQACCVRDHDGRLNGQCGVLFPLAYPSDEPSCEPIVAGELDEICLDAIVGGDRIEGCRRSDGRCGHLSPGWGCHLMYRHYWDWELDDANTTLPNPFVCTKHLEPCTRTTQCCFHPNYGSVCVPAPGQDLDASVEELEGICDNDDDLPFTKTPFPRF